MPMRLRLVPRLTTFDFVGARRIAVGLSLGLVLMSLAALPTLGLNLGVDFRGGTMIMAQTAGAPDLAAFRAALGTGALGEVSITEVSDPAAQLTGADGAGLMVRVGSSATEDGAAVDVVAEAEALMTAVDPTTRFLSVETVGGRVSAELLQTGLLAMVLALAAILIYIWLRFEWQFAVGAVVALAHDVIVTLGLFSLFQFEFNLTIVAALLTLIGYGINDTVVMFDRVRENLRRYKTMPLADLLNLSINQTLARTVMTAMTTFLAIFAMFALGGEVLRGFNIAMLWGVVVGCYSTVFVAAVIVLWLGVEREPKDAAAGVTFGAADAP